MKPIVKNSIVIALVVIAVAALAFDFFGNFDAGNVVSGISGGLVVALRGNRA